MADYYEPGPQALDRERPPRQSVEREREPHALNLKVLRASRPSLTQSQDLARDVTSSGLASTSGFKLTPMLALPAAFGNINLGETFLGVIVAANETNKDVQDPVLKIEIQTANSRTTLWESPAVNPEKPKTLRPGDVLEAPLLDYEIKEPGLHALTCTVSYWPPAPSPFGDPNAPAERLGRSFRKLYKFQATNPLSVKTKVHSSKNIVASLDEKVEATVFLEVQIQNISSEPLLFEQLRFDVCDGLQAQDHNASQSTPLQPMDILQCLYIISPITGQKQSVFERARLAGGAMALGKLDIRWRGRMGESGHLTTSQLYRKLPMPAVAPILSVRPSLQNVRSGLASLTPSQTPERPALRAPSPGNSPRLSTGTLSPSSRGSFEEIPRHLAQSRNLQAHLYTLPLPDETLVPQKPFKLSFQLKLVSTCKVPDGNKRRRLKLAVQHVDHGHRPVGKSGQQLVDETPIASARQSLETSRPLPPTPRRSMEAAQTSSDSGETLPPPYPLTDDHPFAYRHTSFTPSQDVSYVGHSLIVLDDVMLDHSTPAKRVSVVGQSDSEAGSENVRISIDSTATDDLSLSDVVKKRAASHQQTTCIDFTLEYIAFATGIQRVGGLRILLLEDDWLEGEIQGGHEGLKRCTLVEHGVVAEIVIEPN